MKKTIIWATTLFMTTTLTSTVLAEDTVTNNSGLSSMYGVNGQDEAYYSEDNTIIPAPETPSVEPPVANIDAQQSTFNPSASEATINTVEPPVSGTSSMYGEVTGTEIYSEENDTIAPPKSAEIKENKLVVQQPSPSSIAQPANNTQPTTISQVVIAPAQQPTSLITLTNITKAKQQLYTIAQLTPADYATKIATASLHLLIQK